MTRLDLELFLRRSGWLVWVAMALAMAAAGLHFVATPGIRAQTVETARSLAAARLAMAEATKPAAPGKSLLEQRHEAFQAVLGVRGEQGRVVAAVFEQAARQGLTLARAEYKLETDRTGRFHAYQMTLPVRGAYPQIQRFVHETLAALPGAALEEITFRRDAVGATEPEARLRFVFFLRDAAP